MTPCDAKLASTSPLTCRLDAFHEGLHEHGTTKWNYDAREDAKNEWKRSKDICQGCGWVQANVNNPAGHPRACSNCGWSREWTRLGT
jgi:hypothetical protein